MMKKIILLMALMSFGVQAVTLRFATFNVSMEAGNYIPKGTSPVGDELFKQLSTGENPQIRNIAEIIQRVRPHVLLLNEFDYSPDKQKGVEAFQKNYLSHPQQNQKAIEYPYIYLAPVNTGVDSGIDLNRDGVASGTRGDAFGFGQYPGQYGMVLLSQYPIEEQAVRTFQTFLWKDMPGNGLDKIKTPEGELWYPKKAQEVLRLSSKSHWDIPLIIKGKKIHVLASHPTPPVFDGPENRNGYRNHDENRFWMDYFEPATSGYIYDDKKVRGGFKGEYFVVMGDLNASPVEGDGLKQGILGLLNHPKVNQAKAPISEGGKMHTPGNPHGATHTAGWRMRADYVLPSNTLEVKDSGVFWPTQGSDLERLIKDRTSSSDHRLVWVDVSF